MTVSPMILTMIETGDLATWQKAVATAPAPVNYDAQAEALIVHDRQEWLKQLVHQHGRALNLEQLAIFAINQTQPRLGCYRLLMAELHTLSQMMRRQAA